MGSTDVEQESRDIPEDVKRGVRRRCGFGCVICGLPLYEYEHMLGYVNVGRHRVDEITLLCDRHHREKTAKLLPLAVVQAADANPINLRSGESSAYPLHYAGPSCAMDVGGNIFTFNSTNEPATIVALSIDDMIMVGFDLVDQQLLLTLNVFDENNEPVLRIVRNELAYSVTPWDIRLVGTRLQVRPRLGQFLTDIIFEPPDRVRVYRGHFLYNGVDVLIRPNYLVVVNNCRMVDGLTIQNVQGGIVIGNDSPYTGAVGIYDVPRYEQYSEPDRRAARAYARSAEDN